MTQNWEHYLRIGKDTLSYSNTAMKEYVKFISSQALVCVVIFFLMFLIGYIPKWFFISHIFSLIMVSPLLFSDQGYGLVAFIKSFYSRLLLRKGWILFEIVASVLLFISLVDLLTFSRDEINFIQLILGVIACYFIFSAIRTNLKKYLLLDLKIGNAVFAVIMVVVSYYAKSSLISFVGESDGSLVIYSLTSQP